MEFSQGARLDYFAENFGTDNMKYLGISNVLVLDALGRPLAGAQLTAEPSLEPISESMSQALRNSVVSVSSDDTSKTVMPTYPKVSP